MDNKKRHISIITWIKYWYQITWKFRILRLAIKWRRFKSMFDIKPEIDNMQSRAIQLFLVLLKNKDTSLNHSPESSVRFLESESLWITLEYYGDNRTYLITIIDETNFNHVHSNGVFIPKECAYEIMNEFDKELEKRFRSMESIKKKAIINDLEGLIKQVKNINSTQDKEIFLE